MIFQIQGKDPSANESVGGNGGNDGGYQTATEGGNANEQEEELPMPDYNNLQTIVDDLSAAVGDVIKKRRACQIIMQNNVSQL